MAEVSYVYPPDGYMFTEDSGSEDWQDVGAMDTTNFVSGVDSVLFLATGEPNAYLIEDGDHVHPWEPGTPALIEGVGRAAANAADQHLMLGIDWLDSAKAILSTDYACNAEAGAINTWEVKSGVFTAPASTAFMRARFGRNVTGASANFKVWWDSVYVRRFPKEFHAVKSSGAQTLSSSVSASKVTFDSELYDHGNVYDNVTNNRYTAQATGPVQVHASLQLYDAAFNGGGSYSYMYLYKNGASLLALDFKDLAAGSTICQLQGGLPVFLTVGDYLEIWAMQNDGQNLSILNNNATRFSVTSL